ncbi:hypothetical protein KJ682_06225 [bacterium]|nr:hypothetical protein [bacterium]
MAASFPRECSRSGPVRKQDPHYPRQVTLVGNDLLVAERAESWSRLKAVYR